MTLLAEHPRPAALSPAQTAGWSTRWFALAAGALLSLIMCHHPMLFSGLRLMQTDEGDTRLINYLLEHGYLWLRLDARHAVFQTPPFFSPQQNVIAYSDILFSFGPLYWAARLLHIRPDTSYQLWLLGVTAINYFLFYAILRKGVGVGAMAAVFGAVLFAASGSHTSTLTHSQLQCQAYVLLSVLALFFIFGPADSAAALARRRRIWIPTLGLSVALQLWGGFYFFFFLVLVLGIVAVVALCIASHRRAIYSVCVAHPLTLLLTAIASGMVVAPLVHHYLIVQQTLGEHDFETVKSMLARPASWFYMGDFTVLYGWMNHIPWFANLINRDEQAMGLGLVTTGVVIAGLWAARRRPGVLLMALTSMAIIILPTIFFERFTLWSIIYRFMPGAGAARSVARLGLMLTIPASIGLALFIDRFSQGRRAWVVYALALVCLAEQLVHTAAYDKLAVRRRVQQLADRVPPTAARFFYSSSRGDRTEAHLDAMWASLICGVPTINGSPDGNMPPGYEIFNNVTTDPEQFRELQRGMDRWLALNGLDPASVVWIRDRTDSPDPDNNRLLVAASAQKALTDANYINIPENKRLTMSDAAPFLGIGWSYPETARWTDGHAAEIHFAIPEPAPLTLRLNAMVNLAPGKLEAQRAVVALNGVRVGMLRMIDPGFRTYSVTLPLTLLKQDNTIRIMLPDAMSPAMLTGEKDSRLLGIGCRWLEIDADAPEDP